MEVRGPIHAAIVAVDRRARRLAAWLTSAAMRRRGMNKHDLRREVCSFRGVALLLAAGTVDYVPFGAVMAFVAGFCLGYLSRMPATWREMDRLARDLRTARGYESELRRTAVAELRHSRDAAIEIPSSCLAIAAGAGTAAVALAGHGPTSLAWPLVFLTLSSAGRFLSYYLTLTPPAPPSSGRTSTVDPYAVTAGA